MKVLWKIPLLSIFIRLLLAVWGSGWAARTKPNFSAALNFTHLHSPAGQRVLCGSSQYEGAPTGKDLITRVASNAKNLTSIFRYKSFSQLHTLWLCPFEVSHYMKLSLKMWHRYNYT